MATHSGGGVRLSRLAVRPPRLRGAIAALTDWHRCCTLAPKEGGGWCARAGTRRAAPCRLLGCAAMRQRAVTCARVLRCPQRRGREPPRGADGPHRRWPGRVSARPCGWAGANTTDCAQRLTGTLAVSAQPIPHWPWLSARGGPYTACRLAARAGQGAQDITGVAQTRQGAPAVRPPSEAASAATGRTLCNSPLC
jgi:hypothetical protein